MRSSNCISSRSSCGTSRLSGRSSGNIICKCSKGHSPAPTISKAVQQARASFRAFREDVKEGKVSKSNPDHPFCCRIQIPVPHPDDEETIRVLDESEFPGGILQRFRQLRPRIEDVLFGYEPEFVGMARDAADGVGVWRCGPSTTAIANVNTLTFESLLDLCEGRYGSAPLQPDHIVLAINCSWGSAEDVGQFWQRDLKDRSAAVIAERTWHDVYHLWAVRTSGGAAGWLYHAWRQPWEVYECADSDGTERGNLVKKFTGSWAVGGGSLRPEGGEVAAALAGAGRGGERKKSIRLW